MRKGFLIIAAALACLSACAHVIPKDTLQQVDTELTFSALQKAPEEYKGKVVVLGGIIVGLVNKKEGTILEVYQTQMDREGRPIKLDISGGRFLVLYKGLLDSEIYRKGRRVTIAGIVQGEKVMRLGELEYHYPYLVIKDLHLWKEELPQSYEYYPWGLWGPWWWHPWYPWYDRYGRPW
jgi:outer membrane lipoprotein